MKSTYLGLGTNLGERENNLKEAIAMIGESIGRIVASSPVYETEPWGFKSESQFLNMVVQAETKLGPSGLLRSILMIEANLGRLRDQKKYSSRTIDIDILMYDKQIINRASLVIPHPMLQERRFVLVPLCEIAPDVVHPVMKKTFVTLLRECKDTSKVVIYNNPLSAKL
jgi:2-amino-4-hydroxy-6-hydroxymethyldihydropteridine diphosphokinase